MRVSFLLMLFGSWVVNPAAIVIAHFLKVDNNPILVHVLLAMSFNLPFALILNEVLAACEARLGKGSQTSYLLLIGQFLLSSVLISHVILGEANVTYPAIMLALILAISSFYSYKSVTLAYRLISNHSLSKRYLALAGSIPGLATILIYCLYFALFDTNRQVADFMLYGICLLPSCAQYLVLRMKHHAVAPIRESDYDEVLPKVFLILFVQLSCLSLAGLIARQTITNNAGELAAVTLVLINGFLSLFSTLAKADYFLCKVQLQSAWITTVLALIAVFTCVYTWATGNSLIAIMCLVAAQYASVRLIISARHKVTVQKHPANQHEFEADPRSIVQHGNVQALEGK